METTTNSNALKKDLDSKKNRNQEGQKYASGRIDFVGKSPFFTGVSLLLMLISGVLLVTQGLNYGIDFAGGTEIQVQFSSEVSSSDVRAVGEELQLQNLTVQRFGEENEYLLRFRSDGGGMTEKETNEKLQADIQSVRAAFSERFTEQNPDIRRVDSVGPQVGNELKRNGLLACFYSLLVILIYIGLRFDYKYAPAAVLTLFHDVLITLGIFILLGQEVNIQILAAILTLIGYSLNDTIINFDRIRENEGLYRNQALKFVVNRSINDVLSRTIVTSVTTFVTVVALYVIATGVIKDLALALGIGIVIGTYSSIYVAAPLVMLTEKLTGTGRKKAA